MIEFFVERDHKIMKRSASLTLCMMICFHVCFPKLSWSQTKESTHIKSLIPSSPQAASFGKYVDVPVSAYTGTPNINIPIAAVRGRTLSLPISLSYHHKGLQVEGQASQVGLGWSLAAGGVISRSVKGEVDEKSAMTRYDQITDIQNNLSHDFFDKIWKARQDGAPDVYTFNFAGYSGRFIMYQNKAYFFSYSRLKVTHLSGGDTFTMVTENGTKYIFGKVETTNNESGADITSYNSAWFLTQVIAADQKDSITLHYAPTANAISKSIDSYQYSLTCGNNLTYSNSVTTINGQTLASIESSLMKVVFEQDAQPRLDLTTQKALKTIRIYDKQDLSNALKTFQLTQGYFGNNVHLKLTGVTEFDKNLQPKPAYQFEYHEALTVPQRSSKAQDHWGFFNGAGNSNLIPKESANQPLGNANRTPNFEATRTTVLKKITYPTGGYTTFEYEQNTYENISQEVSKEDKMAISRLNPMNVSGVIEQTETLTITIPQTVKLLYSAKRHKAISGIKEGLNDIELKNDKGQVIWYLYTGHNAAAEAGIQGSESIALSPGTYTLTTKAENRDDILGQIRFFAYGSKVSTKKAGPGLRVKQVTAYDNIHSQPVKVQQYQYEGGILQTPYQNYSPGPFTSSVRGNAPDGVEPECTTCVYTRVSSNPQSFRYFFTYSNYALVYTKVTEFIGKNGKGGKNVTYYEIPDQEDFNNVTMKAQKSYAFEATTNTFRLVKEIINDYQEVVDQTFFGIVIRLTGTADCAEHSEPVNTYFREIYQLPMRWRYLAQTTEKSYDDKNQLMTSQVTMHYSHTHRYPNEVITINSKGEKLLNRRKYPEDYVSGIAGFLVNKNILSTVLEEQTWQEKAGVQTLLGGQITAFEPTTLKPYKIYVLETNQALTDLNQESKTNALYNTLISDSHYQLKATFGFDQVYNVNHQQKTDDVSVSYLWGYDDTYPIAKVVNAAPDQIFHTSFEDVPLSGNVVSGNAYTGTKSWQGAYTIPNGQKPAAGTYRLTYQEKVGEAWELRETTVNYDPAVNATLISTASVIDEVRMYPRDAQMMTYTFDRIYGITSSNDINSRPTYYIYDAFGRLQLVKDHEQNIIKKYQYIYQQD